MKNIPEIGSIWRHKNGNLYRVVLITNTESTRQDEYPTTVSYENIHNKTLWSRAYARWHGSMTAVDDPLELDALFGIDR